VRIENKKVRESSPYSDTVPDSQFLLKDIKVSRRCKATPSVSISNSSAFSYIPYAIKRSLSLSKSSFIRSIVVLPTVISARFERTTSWITQRRRNQSRPHAIRMAFDSLDSYPGKIGPPGPGLVDELLRFLRHILHFIHCHFDALITKPKPCNCFRGLLVDFANETDFYALLAVVILVDTDYVDT
jgi:hypothetical protein